MRASRAFLALAGAGLVVSLAASGCTNSCQELGDRICNCQPVGAPQTACQTDVRNRISAANPNSGQLSYCSNLLKTCPEPPANWNASSPPVECALLETCQGKVNCGLALPQPGSLDGGCVDLTPVEFTDGGAADAGAPDGG
ncbi:MAG TPA: hypothetical protein VMK42_07855 [Anaeromyxobacteraceae bacterium]|nr:hypothetical protein [Anaeromyxobacteraceae bacterium]